MKNEYCVYVHLKKDNGQIFYVGKGKKRRPNDRKRNVVWNRIVAKHGFDVKIVAKDLYENEAFELEKSLIKQYRDSGLFLANFTDGGDGSSGYKHSEETKLKIGNASRNMIRRKESRKKLSESRLKLGIHMTVETKLKMVKSKGTRPFISIAPNGEIRHWNFQTECANTLNLNISHVNQCLKGNRPHHKGYKFEYKGTF